MGNEASAPGRGRASVPHLSKEEFMKLEGDRYVIFPHLVPDPAPQSSADTASDAEPIAADPPPAQEDPQPGEEEGEQQQHEHRQVQFHDANKAGKEQQDNTPVKAPQPSWTHMVEVLNRDITDLDSFESALVDMRTGPPPLVAAFKHLFRREPGFEARFFEAILPTIKRLALKLPEAFPAEHRLPLLLCGENGEVTLTQEQCAVLISSSLMGTLWVQPAAYSKFKFPSFKVQSLFVNKAGPSTEILRMVLHYFDRLSFEIPQGKVTFRRQVLHSPPDWANSGKPMMPAHAKAKGKIEESESRCHADFANQYIGGGVLHGGCVQEEILFAIKPECLVSMLFCAKMRDDEAIFITGAERFSNYSGYAQSLTFAGNHIDQTPRDSEGRIHTTIVAIDAVVAFGGRQWQEDAILRDLNKVYCGCWEPKRKADEALDPFATGNWGCGAFGGDKSLKVLQQMMAASQADRELLYYTFGEMYGRKSLKEWIKLINELIAQHRPTVGDVYQLIQRYAPKPWEHRNANLFEMLLHHYSPKDEGEPANPSHAPPSVHANPAEVKPPEASHPHEESEES